jgi:hypothetical protein
MSHQYNLYLSLTGEIIVKNEESLCVWVIDNIGIRQAFANDNELHAMILFPIGSSPKGKIWKRHREELEKFLANRK